MATLPSSAPRLKRIVRNDFPTIAFTLDGVAQIGRTGDTVLSAILTLTGSLRQSDFSSQRRAGFCLMGACQDCWIWQDDGSRVRACSTALQAGMRLLTRAPGLAP